MMEAIGYDGNFFDTVKVGLLLVNSGGKVVTINAAARKMLSISGNANPRDITKFLYTHFLDSEFCLFRKDVHPVYHTIQTRKSTIDKLVYVRKNTETNYHKLKMNVLIMNTAGNEFDAVVILLDNHESSDFFMECLDSRKKLDILFNNTEELQALIEIDSDKKYRILAVNRAFVKTAGKLGYDLYGKDFTEKVLKDVVEYVLKSDKDHGTTENGTGGPLGSGEPFCYDEVIDFGDNKYYGKSRIIPILEQGNSRKELFWLSQNLTKQFLVENELKKNTSHLEKALDIGLLCQWNYDYREDRFLWTENALNILGMDVAGDIATLKDFTERVYQDDKKLILKKVEDSWKSGLFDQEFRLMTGSNIKWFRLKYHIEFDSRKIPVRAFGMLGDITRKKESEIELLKMNEKYHLVHKKYSTLSDDLVETMDRFQKIKGELEVLKRKARESDKLQKAFLANLSHEIRTPMNGILGFSELLKNPDLSGERSKQYINIILDSGKRMLNVITDLVEIAKIDSGVIMVNRDRANLNKLIADLYREFEPEAVKRDLKLFSETGLSDEESVVVTDLNKVSQTLSLLLGNSLKFTESGKVVFGYKVIKRLHPVIEFFVKDTGIGIPANLTETIFEEFRQVDSGPSRLKDGMGLGLSISKKYVELLGGRIWVESELNKGSTFYFTIPLHAENSSPAFDYRDVSSMVKSSEKVTILIAEDDDVCFWLMNESFKKMHINILRAVNGKMAVEFVKNIPEIKMILMDINMPVMNGLDATKIIRKYRPDIPIIGQTTFASEMDVKLGLKAGCNEYLTKPLDVKLLMKRIARYAC